MRKKTVGVIATTAPAMAAGPIESPTAEVRPEASSAAQTSTAIIRMASTMRSGDSVRSDGQPTIA